MHAPLHAQQYALLRMAHPSAHEQVEVIPQAAGLQAVWRCGFGSCRSRRLGRRILQRMLRKQVGRDGRDARQRPPYRLHLQQGTSGEPGHFIRSM